MQILGLSLSHLLLHQSRQYDLPRPPVDLEDGW